MTMGDWEPLELLRHTRHDWLNQLQLIKANLSLNRIERAKDIIDEVSARSYNESKLSNLRIPKVAEMLLTFNWVLHPYHLRVEVVGEAQDLSSVQQSLLDNLDSFFRHLDGGVDRMCENHVAVIFDLKGDGTYLTVDFSGRLKNPEAFKQGLDVHKWNETAEPYVSEEEFVLTVRLT